MMTDFPEHGTDQNIPDVFRAPPAPGERPAARREQGRFTMALLGALFLAVVFGASVWHLLSTNQALEDAKDKHTEQMQAEEARKATVGQYDNVDGSIFAPLDVSLRSLVSLKGQPLPPSSYPPDSEAGAAQLAAINVRDNPDSWIADREAELRGYNALLPDTAVLKPDGPKIPADQKDPAAVLGRDLREYRDALRLPQPPPRRREGRVVPQIEGETK